MSSMLLNIFFAMKGKTQSEIRLAIRSSTFMGRIIPASTSFLICLRMILGLTPFIFNIATRREGFLATSLTRKPGINGF